jgi:aldose 1-epimerase
MFNITRIGRGTNWESVSLSDQESGLALEVVPCAGAILNAARIGGFNLVDGYLDKEDFKTRLLLGFRSAKLSPFVCRLHEAGYSWQGINYRLDKFLLNGSALHGILYDAPFEVVSEKQGEHECSVELNYHYAGDHSGYPFPFNCTVTYTLSKGCTISITTQVSNPGSSSSAIPMADGWHPYFTLGGTANDWWLQIASDQMLEYNEQLIPTGRYIQNGNFAEGRLIGEMKLDNGFLLKENISPFCVLYNRENGLCVRFLSHKNYPFLQLYIPDNRNSIAIENLSSAPDSFNNGIGLITLEPGQKMEFSVSICLLIEKYNY